MTNKEKYQRAFSVLHASGECLMEVRSMNRATKRLIPRLAAACLAVVMAVGMSVAAYAADIGGIQRKVQIWLHGEQTDAVLEVQDGRYTVGYTDENGDKREVQGGGVAIEPNGGERPVTEEEIMEHLNMPEVAYEEDGSVWVYFRDQKIEVTDKFDENGICYVTLKDGGQSRYLTIKYDGGFAMNPHKYPAPDTFNTYR